MKIQDMQVLSTLYMMEELRKKYDRDLGFSSSSSGSFTISKEASMTSLAAIMCSGTKSKTLIIAPLTEERYKIVSPKGIYGHVNSQKKNVLKITELSRKQKTPLKTATQRRIAEEEEERSLQATGSGATSAQQGREQSENQEVEMSIDIESDGSEHGEENEGAQDEEESPSPKKSSEKSRKRRRENTLPAKRARKLRKKK